jgi:uncharacterized damage-inducible protein DinB
MERRMTAQEMLAEVVLASKDLLTRFLSGFSEENRTRQAENLPNHIIWTLGHLALTLHRVAERIDSEPLPERDFVTGDGSAATTSQFDTESICFGSQPMADDARYPTLARGIEVYEAACDRLADAVRAAEPAVLDRVIPWHGGEMTLRALVSRVAFHNGAHAGQITDLRRALGLERVIQ